MTPALLALLFATAAPFNGWPAQGAPNGRVLPFDLSRLDESKLLRPGRAQRESLILAHGMGGLVSRHALDELYMGPGKGLERYYPRYSGDHMGVLQEHPGQTSLLDHWSEALQ